MVAALDFIGTLGFAVAAVFALRTYRMTKHLSYYWVVFALGMGVAAVWSALVGLEWLGWQSALLDEVQQPVVASAVTALAMCALLTREDFIKPL
ncbi:hypothetical protein J4439_00995 [Candidatus Woesearchaeota archaeon]|nr:hypothetical protein [Candidatus Woesearchaeota archaeon]